MILDGIQHKLDCISSLSFYPVTSLLWTLVNNILTCFIILLLDMASCNAHLLWARILDNISTILFYSFCFECLIPYCFSFLKNKILLTSCFPFRKLGVEFLDLYLLAPLVLTLILIYYYLYFIPFQRFIHWVGPRHTIFISTCLGPKIRQIWNQKQFPIKFPFPLIDKSNFL